MNMIYAMNETLRDLARTWHAVGCTVEQESAYAAGLSRALGLTELFEREWTAWIADPTRDPDDRVVWRGRELQPLAEGRQPPTVPPPARVQETVAFWECFQWESIYPKVFLLAHPLCDPWVVLCSRADDDDLQQGYWGELYGADGVPLAVVYPHVPGRPRRFVWKDAYTSREESNLESVFLASPAKHDRAHHPERPAARREDCAVCRWEGKPPAPGARGLMTPPGGWAYDQAVRWWWHPAKSAQQAPPGPRAMPY